MPIIVVGADTTLGGAVIDALSARGGEVRAFVTDPDIAVALKQRGVKVASGDVSDGSHIAGAALNTFCAVVLPEATRDDRERSFAATPGAVLQAWADAIAEAGVHRVIWVDDSETSDDPTAAEPRTALAAAVPEFAVISGASRSVGDIAAEVARLDSAAVV